MNLEQTKTAGLTRAEVIALVLYTGPMFMLYNIVLRKYPKTMYDSMKAKDTLFSTTIFVLTTAIQKMARVMVLQPGQALYRGVDGNMDLPDLFYKPDECGCIGMMEHAFMSTTGVVDWMVLYTQPYLILG